MEPQQQRILKNTLALISGIGTYTVIQVISVPLFLHFLDFEEYSTWLVAFNITQFTLVLDFGVLNSSQNRFVFLTTHNKNEEIKERIHQIWSLLISANLVFVFILIVLIKITFLNIDLRLIGLFVLSNILQMSFGIFEALTRSESKTWIGLYTGNFLRVGEFLGITVGLIYANHSLLQIAIWGLVLKFLIYLLIACKYHTDYNFIRFNAPNLLMLKNCIREGFPFFVTKIADIAMLSGVVIVLQNALTPEHLVLFISARTFFRLGLQFTNLSNYVFGYEMSQSWADGNLTHLKLLIRRSSRLTLAFAMCTVVLYTTVGDKFFSLWTKGNLNLSKQLLVFGTLYGLILIINNGQKFKFYAINSNQKVAYIVAFLASIQILFCIIFKNLFSIESLFLSLLINETFCYLMVLVGTRSIIASQFPSQD